MTTVEFSGFEMADANEAVTIEEIFKKWAAFASIHAFNFDDTMTNFDATKWTTISNVSYGSTLARTGSVGANTAAWYSLRMPHSYQLEFTAHQPKWTIRLRANVISGSYYELTYSKPDALVSIKYVSGSGTDRFNEFELFADQQVDWGRVKIMVHDQWGTADDGQLLQYISLWVNDELLLSNCVNLAGSGTDLYFGFLVYAGSAGTLFSDLRVANLVDIQPTSSLDPAGSPLSAIQLAVQDRYVRWWMRWDGSLRAWTPTIRSNTLTVNRHKQFSLSPVTDIRQLFTHIRVLGAFAWVQVKDDSLIQWYGHRFAEIQNSAMWFADDCYRVGQQLLIRSKEQAFQCQFSSLGMALCEVEDRIQLPDISSTSAYIDYVVDNMSLEFNIDAFHTSGTARQYFYG